MAVANAVEKITIEEDLNMEDVPQPSVEEEPSEKIPSEELIEEESNEETLEEAPEEEKILSAEELGRTLECLLLAAGEPIPLKRLADVLKTEQKRVESTLVELMKRYDENQSGLQVLQLAGGYQLATRPEYAWALERYFAKIRRTRLSPASLETLAIIAYKQPVTRAEVEAIRGVNVDGVFNTLLEKDMLKIVGRKEDLGRPLLYGTTAEFLNHFGLVSLNELPPIENFVLDAIEREEEELSPEERAYRRLLEGGDVKPELVELAQAAEQELAEIERRLKHIKVPRAAKPKGEAENSAENADAAQ